MTLEGKVALSGLFALAIWLFVGLPLIYLYLPSNFPMLSIIKVLITPSVALLGVLIASRQLSLVRQNQRETTAKTTFREFLKLCVEYPKFASGDQDGKRRQYEWFVAHFLWAAEEILDYAPDSWRDNLRLYVIYHRKYLQYDRDFREEDFPTYSEKLRTFIDETIASLPPAD